MWYSHLRHSQLLLQQQSIIYSSAVSVGQACHHRVFGIPLESGAQRSNISTWGQTPFMSVNHSIKYKTHTHVHLYKELRMNCVLHRSLLWRQAMYTEHWEFHSCHSRYHSRNDTAIAAAAESMKKAFGETQTLRAGCSKAEPKIFAPPQTPFPGVQDSQNLISWRWSLPLPTDPVWCGSMHTISSYRGNRPTKPQTHNARQL